jgi:hypothetical protein
VQQCGVLLRGSAHNSWLWTLLLLRGKCNIAEYSSEAPPITPDSKLYCYSGVSIFV